MGIHGLYFFKKVTKALNSIYIEIRTKDQSDPQWNADGIN